jgi:hypothetical protein
MTQAGPPDTPAERLTGQILESLISDALLSDDLAAQIASRIAQGKMQPADWKRTFEQSLGLHQRP